SCSACFSGCICARSSKAPASGSPLSSASSIATAGRSGPKARSIRARPSISRCPGHERSYEGGAFAMTTLGRILLVEDDPQDIELTMTALEEYKLANEVVIA